jgi:hypothetical protein
MTEQGPGRPDDADLHSTSTDDQPTTAETTMSEQHDTPDERDDRQDPTLSSQLGWPDATAAVAASATSPLPQATDPGPDAPGPAGAPVEQPVPFRVEPRTPVPDDVVRDEPEAPDLRHLPPPSVPQPAPAPRPYVTVRRGPRPGTVVLGLLAMIVSGYVLAANLTDADLSFRLVGPALIGAFGGLLLLIGLAGVIVGRLRR